jgi:hypothetical protein
MWTRYVLVLGDCNVYIRGRLLGGGNVHDSIRKGEEGCWTKQWPLAPNSRDSLITRANVSRQVTFFFKNGIWRMSASLASPSKTGWRMSASLVSPSKPGWRMSASLVSPSKPGWRMSAKWWVLAKPLDECWHKKDRLFYAQITYFICIKRSILHSLNSPNSPNSRKTCLLRVWRVLAKWFGECQWVWRVRANQVGKCWRI